MQRTPVKLRRTILRNKLRIDSVKRRLVFDEEKLSTIHIAKTVCKDNQSVPSGTSMAQAFVEKIENNITVLFFAYKPYKSDKYYCPICIDIELKRELSIYETEFIISGEIPLSQFSVKEQQDKSNYCYLCRDPLYKIVDEQCRFSPTSRQWQKRFHFNQRYGHQGGGT